MTVKFEKSIAKGRMMAPPSKSMAHRYLICGAFSKGSTIKKIDFGELYDKGMSEKNNKN